MTVAPLASLALAVILLLTACSSAGTKGSATAVASPSATQAEQPTAAATSAAIADLNAFRASLSAAFTGGKWAPVATLLSPAFTFAGSNTGGSQLVMPDAATEFNTLYTTDLSWTQQNSSLLSLYTCFAGNTPNNQLMLFGGANNVLVMVGIQRWQGYWVLAWAFQNTHDSSGYCL